MGKKGHKSEGTKTKKLSKKELKKLNHDKLMNKNKGNSSGENWEDNKKAA